MVGAVYKKFDNQRKTSQFMIKQVKNNEGKMQFEEDEE